MSSTSPSRKIVVIGGGICGLAAGMMLADDGHQVTVLERDPAPAPTGHQDISSWERRSVAQFGLPHWMVPRGTSIIRESLPKVHDLLCDNGALRFNIVKYLLDGQPDAAFTDDDDRFDLVSGRRGMVEWAFATAAETHPNLEIQRGVAITGLIADSDGRSVPHVSGLRLENGETVTADLIVDATGRKSPTPKWLEEIGASAPTEVSAESGFAYYARYFRSPDGHPEILAPILTAYESFSALTLPADNGTWSMTIYGLVEDKPLRRLRELDVYERVVESLPLHRHWIDAEPLGDMVSMVGVVDRERSYVIDGVPCATGLVTIGDALVCTNPSLGRGMTLGLMHVEILRDVVASHIDNPMDLAMALHDRTTADLTPYHDATTRMDRARSTEMQIYAAGNTPDPTPEEKIAAVVRDHAMLDPTMARFYSEVMSCTALADEVLARPGVFERIIELGEGPQPAALAGPDRAQLLELVG